jgi:predicted Holliday junction resolvase-like endonuclease
MNTELIKFFSYQRQIFGVCPCCGELFRLSDCKVYRKDAPITDWKEKLEKQSTALDRFEEKLDEKMDALREKARETGRKQADKLIKKVDPVFAPLKLNPDDAKVVFHPIDFLVFSGMKAKDLKSLIVLDSKEKPKDLLSIQESVMNTISKGNYEWLTMNVEIGGKITMK